MNSASITRWYLTTVNLVCHAIIDALNDMGGAIEGVAQALNALPDVFATDFPRMPSAVSIANECHPLMLQTYKPVLTMGDGDCMYHALSRGVCGSEQLTRIFRLVTAYSVAKYRDVLIQSLQDIYPLLPCDDHVRKTNTLIVHALQTGRWGSDYHLFLLSLPLDRPIFTYCTFYCTDENDVRVLSLSDCNSVHVFAQRFLRFHPETRRHQ